MKKFLMSVVGSVTLFGWLFFLTSVSAHTDCKEVEFDHETVCVSIEDAGHDRFSLLAENTDGTEGTLRCDIMLPDSTLQSIPSCDGSFTYTKGDEGRIKLWIRSNEEAPDDREDKPSSSSTRTYPQWMYNFDDAEWADSNLDDESEYDTDNFYITASPSDPEEDEEVDITVKARDGTSTDEEYRGRVNFTVERKSGSTWVDASSSYYDLARTSYTFTSSDDGEHDFNNLVTFTNDAYDYRLVVTDDDDDDIVGYKTFYLNGDGSDSEYDTDNFYLTASPTDPEEDEYVDITVKARDGTSTDDAYRWRVDFTVQRKSWSSRVSASSSYYTLSRTYYTFTSSDDGEHDFSNLVRFRNDAYDYRLVATDHSDDDIVGYKTFYLNGNGSNNEYDTDNFYLTASPTDPEEDEYVDITVKARDGTSTDEEYRGTVNFSVERKSGSTWVDASSSYYTLARTSYTFTSSDDGEHDFSNLVRFRNDAYDYRLVVTDDDDEDIVGSKTFYLNGDGSDSE